MNWTEDIPTDLRLFGRERSREIDHNTIQDFGIGGFTLMEIAGRGAAQFIRENEGDKKNGLFFCGKGNNAGDALVVARYLSDQANHNITIIWAAGDDDLSEDAQKNHQLLKNLNESGVRTSFLNAGDSIEGSHFHYIVDGLLGTGVNSELRSPYDEMVSQINDLNLPTYSLDIPTGIHCDTGNVLGTAVKATCTITFGTKKLGLFLNEGPAHSGDIHFVQLPFPKRYMNQEATLINEKLVSYLPKSNRQADHKYQDGTVHIVAGSEGLTGAAMMAAKSAWKNGAGAVILYTPKKLLPIYEVALPEIIKVPVGSEGDSYFKTDHVESILAKISDKPGPLVIGPGIGREDETLEFTVQLLRKFSGFAVIDADALYSWKELSGIDSKKQKRWILTPHPGELKNACDQSFSDDYQRFNIVKEIASKRGVNILSKGAPTIFTDHQTQSYISEYNTQIFARAGFGDVLSGTIAAKLAVRRDITDATLSALIMGYLAFKQKPNGEIFEPGHLL